MQHLPLQSISEMHFESNAERQNPVNLKFVLLSFFEKSNALHNLNLLFNIPYIISPADPPEEENDYDLKVRTEPFSRLWVKILEVIILTCQFDKTLSKPNLYLRH